MSSISRYALLVAGSVCLVLGIIGAFIPILPTTPFLLLAAACYLKSSPRAYQWLLNSRVLGRHISDYRSGAGVPLAAKVFSISLLWLTICYSVVFVTESLAVRLLLGAIAIGVTIHLVSIPTRRRPRP